MTALILKSFVSPRKNLAEMLHSRKRDQCTTLSKNRCQSTPTRLLVRNNKKQLRNCVSNSKELLTHLYDDDHQGIGIVKFLIGKHFFITGTTGFLGKVLVEKILRVQPDVGKIYVLIKAKNREAAMQRLKNEIINAELLKYVREMHGKSYEAFMLSKLVPVVGDICESDIGLHVDLAHTISQQVDIIVNCAATTNFIERYDVAMNINIRSCSNLMTFAHRCKELKVFLHVSTAYVNGKRKGQILEKPFRMGDTIAKEMFHEAQNSESSLFPPPTLDVEAEMKLASSQNSITTQKMIDLGHKRAKEFGWHDTYVLTKAIGEMMIDEMRGDIPVVIIRPSTIESTWKDPFPGWIQGNRMMDPLILNYGKGQLPGFILDPNVALDIIPVDMVVNSMLAAISKHGSMKRKGRDGGDLAVYQVASSVANPIVFHDLIKFVYQHFNSHPYVNSNGNCINIAPFQVSNSIEQLSAHVWRLTVEQHPHRPLPKLKIIYKKLMKQVEIFVNIYEPYAFYGGRFDNSNTHKLVEAMSEEEKKKFDFDVRSINWEDYIKNIHIPGLRRYII